MMNWQTAFKRMNALADIKVVKGDPKKPFWKFGQENSIRWMADQLGQKGRNGVLVADEVGMGKTRVIMAAILAVVENGGTVATLVPPGLLSQWKKEWDEFVYSLDDVKINCSPILLRSYKSLFENPELTFPLSANEGKWLLISHQFGTPNLRETSGIRRFSLPILAAAIRQQKDGNPRNKFWKALTKEGWTKKCLKEECGDCSDFKKSKCQSNLQVKRAAQFLANNRWGKFRNIDDIREPKDAKPFLNSPDGLQILGDLLGSVDLLVIDEAHKNRGDNSRLENNLKIIEKSPAAKHIAMSATPMGLDPEEWAKLFERISEPYQKHIVTVFDAARKKANKYPKNQEKINNLISASKQFTAFMKPYVTRRLRIDQKEMHALIGLKEGELVPSAHPHRDENKPINIKFTEIDTKWRPYIFGLEAIGKAAKGCKTDDRNLDNLLRKLKLADSRYAAGQIAESNIDDDSTGIDDRDDEDKIDEAIKEYIKENSNKSIESPSGLVLGKLRRIQYWRGILREAASDLSGHPRVQNVADEIEKAVWHPTGKLKKDKILVFGTFKKPLRALWHVLNRRAVLRFLDRKEDGDRNEPPIPAVGVCIKNIEYIWKEYERLVSKHDLGLKRRFASQSDLVIAIEKGGKTYESIRKSLNKQVNSDFMKTLPGAAVIKSVIGKITKLLHARLINEMICRGKTTDNMKCNAIKNRALKIWVEYLESYFDFEEEIGTESQRGITEWKIPSYFIGDENQIKRLKGIERFAEVVGVNELIRLAKNEYGDISGHLGFFARMLDGDVKMDTRRVLQAQFNNIDSFPQVLIAQSQVGREGLNLHEACRTVIQFHSEWNPIVVEQQIGRVDRIESYWQKMASEYNNEHPEESVRNGGFPKIVIRKVVFEGTYDDFQYKVSKHRREMLKAHLFGELLNEEALLEISENLQVKLIEYAPDFSPPI